MRMIGSRVLVDSEPWTVMALVSRDRLHHLGGALSTGWSASPNLLGDPDAALWPTSPRNGRWSSMRSESPRTVQGVGGAATV